MTETQNHSIFSSEALNALEIDFEPPLPANERLIEMDDDEIIELDLDSSNFYRCLRCHKIFTDISAFMIGCNGHIPSFQKLLYGIQRGSKVVKYVKKSKEKSNFETKNGPEEGKYVCDVCGVSFTLRMSIKAHFRVHQNRLKECQYCDAKFTRNVTLRRHESILHENGDRELKARGNNRQALNCAFCDRPFESVNNLRMHESSHFTDRLECIDCGIVCKSEKILKKHQRKHLGLKYPCEICGALLNSVDSLRGHLKYMHSGFKYRCGVCGIEYKHRGNFNDHIAGHLDPSTKVCDICNFEWDTRRSCLEHKRKKHPELKLDYSLPKVDPTDENTMKILKLLIDALPRHNGKPNHLEVCMKGVGQGFQGMGLLKKRKRMTHEKKIDTKNDENERNSVKNDESEQNSMKNDEKQKNSMKNNEISPNNEEISPLNVRKSTRIREKIKKSDKITLLKPRLKEKQPSEPKKITKILDTTLPDDFENEAKDDNRYYATRKDPTLEVYDPNYDYTASEDIFVNDFLQDPDLYDPDFNPKSPKFSKTRDPPSKDFSRSLKPGETLCQICVQPTRALKTHLEHYHSDSLLDRVCRVCQKVAMCKRDLKEHVKKVHKKQFSAYQLELMQKKYALPENLPPELFCIYCPAKFLSRNHLKFHIETLHPTKDVILDTIDNGTSGVSCKLCHKTFPSQDKNFLKRHVNSSHGHSIADCICFLCGEVFVVKNYIKIHLKKVHDAMTLDTYLRDCGTKIEKFREENPEIQCDDCHHSYVDPDDLSYHREVCHKEKHQEMKKFVTKMTPKPPLFPGDFQFGQILEYKCSICGKTFNKQEIYEKHKDQHNFGHLYCKICNKHFTGLSQRREHDAYKHGIGRKKYTCDHCGEKITRRRALVAHFQLKCRAFKERPQLKWFCAELKKQKKEAKQMKKLGLALGSERKGVGGKKETLFPFSHGSEKRMCDICAKICCNDYRLMEHGRKVHNIIFPQYEELYRQDCQETTCPECGKIFSQLGHYIEHKKTHSIEFVTCKVCGIVVKGKKTLARHALIHEPKTFKCDQCGMMFHQKRSMTVHKQEKHSTNSYPCKYCPQLFKYKAILYEHVKSHEIPNYLRCEICNKDYASRSCLRTHRKRTHPEIYGNNGTKSRHQRPQSWNQYLVQMTDDDPSIVEMAPDQNVVKFQVEFLHETEEIV